MKRTYSLKGRKSYNSVFLKGRKKRGKGVIIFVLKRSRSEKPDNQSDFRDIKVGIAVSRKLGKANRRNWIKRRIRSVCNEFIDQMKDGLSIIIKPGQESLEMSYEELRSDIIGVLKNSGVINESG